MTCPTAGGESPFTCPLKERVEPGSRSALAHAACRLRISFRPDRPASLNLHPSLSLTSPFHHASHQKECAHSLSRTLPPQGCSRRTDGQRFFFALL